MCALADDAKPAAGCAFSDEVRSWQDVDPYTAIIELSGNHRYRVTFVNECHDMTDALSVKLVSRPGICVSPGDRMIFKPRGGIEATCVIKTIDVIGNPPAPPQN